MTTITLSRKGIDKFYEMTGGMPKKIVISETALDAIKDEMQAVFPVGPIASEEPPPARTLWGIPIEIAPDASLCGFRFE